MLPLNDGGLCELAEEESESFNLLEELWLP